MKDHTKERIKRFEAGVLPVDEVNTLLLELVIFMALSQADFDTKLNDLQTAVNKLIAAQTPPTPPADLTSEGATVDALTAAVIAATPAPVAAP